MVEVRPGGPYGRQVFRVDQEGFGFDGVGVLAMTKGAAKKKEL